MTREDAIDYLNRLRDEVWNEDSDGYEYAKAIDMAIEALQAQKTGKWIIFPPFIEEICMCSNCKTKFKEAYQHRNICPNCGADMRIRND